MVSKGLFKSGPVLDFGCGASRTTRFLRTLGCDPLGVDASPSMIEAATRADPQGKYFLVTKGDRLPFGNETFAGAFASWVIPTERDAGSIISTLKEIARVLTKGSTAVFIGNTPEFYCNNWISAEVNFPENKPPYNNGQLLKLKLIPQDIEVIDYFWSDNDYLHFFQSAGFKVTEVAKPLAPSNTKLKWKDETKIPPHIIHLVERIV